MGRRTRQMRPWQLMKPRARMMNNQALKMRAWMMGNQVLKLRAHMMGNQALKLKQRLTEDASRVTSAETARSVTEIIMIRDAYISEMGNLPVSLRMSSIPLKVEVAPFATTFVLNEWAFTDLAVIQLKWHSH